MSWKAHLERSYFDLKSPISYASPTKVYKYLKKRENIKLACMISENGYEMSMHTVFNVLRGLKSKLGESFRKA